MRLLILMWTKGWSLPSVTLRLLNQKPSPKCYPVTSLWQILLVSSQPACTLWSCCCLFPDPCSPHPIFFFFFHTYSLNSALAPMGSLAWHWALCQGLSSDQINRSTQFRPPTLGGSSYPRQPPGRKPQLPALQEAQSKHITGGMEGELTLPSSAEEVRAKPRPREWAEWGRGRRAFHTKGVATQWRKRLCLVVCLWTGTPNWF